MAIQRVILTDSRKEDVFYEVLFSQAVIQMKEKVMWLSSLQ